MTEAFSSLLSKMMESSSANVGDVFIIILVSIFVGSNFLVLLNVLKQANADKKREIESREKLAKREGETKEKLATVITGQDKLFNSLHDNQQLLTNILLETKNDYRNLKDFISDKFEVVEDKIEKHSLKLNCLNDEVAGIKGHISSCNKKEKS